MLFDMESDEHENRNLIQDHPEVAKRLEEKLADFRAVQKRPGFTRKGPSQEGVYYEHYFSVKGQ
ncbi:hypothetical protein N8787_03580 [Opitutaceae bacterium]|nr:hypothetical protein [Opitutaceae bacterium]